MSVWLPGVVFHAAIVLVAARLIKLCKFNKAIGIIFWFIILTTIHPLYLYFESILNSVEKNWLRFFFFLSFGNGDAISIIYPSRHKLCSQLLFCLTSLSCLNSAVPTASETLAFTTWTTLRAEETVQGVWPRLSLARRHNAFGLVRPFSVRTSISLSRPFSEHITSRTLKDFLHTLQSIWLGLLKTNLILEIRGSRSLQPHVGPHLRTQERLDPSFWQLRLSQ